MNPDFLQLKTIDGELKLSQKKSDYGVTVSTKEFVFHKPHVNYHIKLEDITSITPFEPVGKRKVSIETRSSDTVEFVSSRAGGDQYRIFVKQAVMHNRSGLFPIGAMQFVIPINERFMKLIGDYSGMHFFE
ncbi:hypothetical protein [Paenibacillus tarimensis]|uniref:hypothetical protein n=1 Tax=Paenibacillus tarimensis TaxID=416012 RepID=UPI001F24BB54|nr:hypothetical protein [Paenibacillus tarimensis]MCF2944723.1 hypothetical protein [Paenibacillus tarimensis]